MDLTTNLPRYSGDSLPELLKLLKREKARYKDFLVGVSKETGGLRSELLPFVGEDGEARMVPGLVFEVEGRVFHVIPTNPAHGQLCDRTLGVRKAYEKIAADCPENLPPIMNHYLRALNGKRRLLRCYEVGEDTLLCRGFLSQAYRTLDHKDIAITALEGAKLAMEEQGFDTPKVKGWALSESRFELTIYSTDLWADFENPEGGTNVKNLPKVVGPWLSRGDAQKILTIGEQGGRDILFAGVRIRNSETGQGTMQIAVNGLRLSCANGQTVGVNLAQVHIGRKKTEELLLRPETIAKDNAIIFDKTRDAVSAAFDPERFQELFSKVAGLKQIETKKPAKAIKVIVEREGMSEETEKALLEAYQVGSTSTPTAFDLYQAVTSVQRTTPDEDVADSLEKVAVALANGDKIVKAVRSR